VVELLCTRTAEAVVTAADVDRVIVRDLFHIDYQHQLDAHRGRRRRAVDGVRRARRVQGLCRSAARSSSRSRRTRQVTTLDYLDSADPLRITKITDPFGRVATLTYDSAGRIATIIDAIGIAPFAQLLCSLRRLVRSI
jgi:YD repeat-containing protein